ncbi:MAG: bifunctional 4-hydroxy-2-oxoglutarate aldolase/2-dehydro-3-deoxy-phosphogluconate aldolase, partial [Bacteroidetes bacterium]
TMNTAGATEIIADLRKAFPTLNIGAGTVCNMHDLEQAIEAGAQFIVTPILDEMVVETTVNMGVPVFPGAYSPTEIYKAWSLGASAVKVFPTSQLGVKYIKDISAPLNQIKLLPTGGVSLSNIKSFFEAGVFGVGMGSSLFDKEALRANDFTALKAHFLKVKSAIGEFLK